MRYLVFVTAFFLSASTILAEKSSRPNFILIIADDMAADDCGATGHPYIQTPNLDQLAAEGLVFEKAFLTCSSCSPSRSSLITCKYPHQTNAEQLHWPLPSDQITFVELLRNAGYYTASSGKWHLGNDAKRAFDAVQEVSVTSFQLPANSDRGDVAIMEDANNASGCAGWVETLRRVPSDQPFFLWLAAVDPHRDYQSGIISNPHKPEDVILPPFIPDTPEVRADFTLYYDEIARLDSYVGAIIGLLNDMRLSENTYVIFLSDNGRPFPRCKTTVFDSGIQTPLFIRVPVNYRSDATIAGKRTTALVSSIDIGATILDIAGVSADESMMGTSFSHILHHPEQGHREAVFAEHNWHDYDANQRAVRSKKFKYIRNYDTNLTLSPPADAVRSPTFKAMRRLRDAGELAETQTQCFEMPRTREELYDLENDPHELSNLAEEPEYQAVLVQHRSLLDQWRLATFDAAMTQRSVDEFDRETGDPLSNRRRPREGKSDGFEPMFNQTDLQGWKRINTHSSTWSLNDGVLTCTGRPIGELRTERMYQNFILELEWRHLIPKGNAGVFVWADDITARGVPFHRGIEVQVLENDYGNTESHTTHGDIFPIHGASMTPINGRGGGRAFPTEWRSNPAPEWNHYRIVCNDGEISLAVNGKVVTRGQDCNPRKGYICLESEGGQVEYRNVRIKELPDTPVSASETAVADRGFRCLYKGIDLEGWTSTTVDNWVAQDWVLSHQASNGMAADELTTVAEFSNPDFIIDVNRRAAESKFAVVAGDMEIASDDRRITESLSKFGTWDRIELSRNSDQVYIVRINGRELLQFPLAKTSRSLKLRAEGPVDFTNVYVHEN